MQFETLRDMLKGFVMANPVRPDYSDPRYVPVREWEFKEGFNFQTTGRTVDDYTSWIYPEHWHSNTGYLGLRVQKEGDNISCLTLSVAAYSASMTYELKFNFGDGESALEMRQGRGANITGERVRFQHVRCVDLLVLDLIDLMLPPQIKAHQPEVYVPDWGNKDKPCIGCGTPIRNNWTVCSSCRPNQIATTA